MSLNCNEIDVILSELDLTGAFVQEVVQPNFDSIALYTYKPGVPKTVFISLAAGACRLNETRRKITKNEKPLRFNEMLKSRIKGARITSCAQIGKERIIKLELEKQGAIYVMPQAQEKLQKIQDKKGNRQEAEALDNGQTQANQSSEENDNSEYYNLYIRLWSNAANIFLCDKNDIILDCFYRRPKKGETSGALLQVESGKLKVESEQELLERFPVRNFEEFLSERASNLSSRASNLSSRASDLSSRASDLSSRASDLSSRAKSRDLSIPLRSSRDDNDELSFNQKVDLYYSENAAQTSLEALLEQAEKWYNSHKSRQVAALERLEEKQKTFLNAGQYKHQGDLILAFGYKLKEASADSNSNFLECEDYESGSTVRIKIDPKKSAQENAASYYELYKKQTSGLENLEYDIASAKKAIEALDKTYAEIIAEKNPIKLEQILRKTQKPRQQEKKTHPGLDYEIDGWYILVGRDASENDELLRHHVKGSDMWFHVRDYHGGYVFVKNRPGKTIPLEIMLYAGNLAVYFSKARKNGSADLYYTQVKHLRRAKNGPKGLVLPTNEKNLFIKLDENKMRKLNENKSE